MGRHKKPGPKRDRAVSRSFGGAAALLGCSVPHLKAYRDAGCPGFAPNGRIDTTEIKKWLLQNAAKIPAPPVWRDSLGSEKLRAQKRQNDYEDGLLVERSKVAEQLQKIFRPVLARVEQMLTNEYPAKVAGLDIPAARVYGKRVLDLILEAHREAALQWT